MTIHEAHVERMLGAKVRDANGEVAGRLEEMIVEVIDGEHVVTEFHLGPAALFERIGAFLGDVPVFSLLPFSRNGYRVAWPDMDLTEPSKPRLRIAKSNLARIELV